MERLKIAEFMGQSSSPSILYIARRPDDRQPPRVRYQCFFKALSTIYRICCSRGRQWYAQYIPYHPPKHLRSIAVVKPPMAKVANVFGRLEAFSFSIFLYILGYIQQAGSNNVQAFASAQIFYSAGSTGLQILIQIFVADTTDLSNRALFSVLPDIPFLINVWVGAPLAQNLLSHTTWRWGYGIWAIVLPVAFMPLALALFLNSRKAKRLGLLHPSPLADNSFFRSVKNLWFDLDTMGLLLICAAFSLILIPITLAATAKGGWHNASIIAMVVVGCLCLFVFPFWEGSSKLAPKPFLSLQLLTNRTLLAGCGIGFFYFGASSHSNSTHH